MTATWVGLLRAVNVGGRNSAPMTRVRAAVESTGARDVRTYVQSGNVLFASSLRSEAKVVDAIAAALAAELGFVVGVVVRSAAAMATVVDANPFVGGGRDLARLAVTFLDDEPAPDVVAPGHQTVAREEYALVGRELYLHAPDGLGRSKLSSVLSERRLGVVATTRNWRTVTTLAAMAR
jgi:uncharacterized protein (DUF1697 family)